MTKTITMITGCLTKYIIDIRDIISIEENKGKDAVTIYTENAEFNIFKKEGDNLNAIVNALKNFCTSPEDTKNFRNNDYLIWIGK